MRRHRSAKVAAVIVTAHRAIRSVPLRCSGRAPGREAARDEQLRNVDRVEFIALIAELAVNLDMAAFLDHAINLLASEHLQHRADFFAPAAAFEARGGRLEVLHVFLPEEALEERLRLFL